MPACLRFPAKSWALPIGVALLGACVNQRVTEPDDASLATAAASSSPVVSSTDPPSTSRDTTLDVRVLGSGFDRGSKADFLLNGQSTLFIRTNSTTFKASSELVANITVSKDAAIDRYDVAVTTSRGKKGIGTEIFAIALVQSLGTLGGTASVAFGINDQGTVVGWSYPPTGPGHPFAWDFGVGMREIGPLPPDMNRGVGYAIANDGSVGGAIDGARPTLAVRWTPLPGDGWSTTQYWLPPGTGGYVKELIGSTGAVGYHGEYGTRLAYWSADGSFTDLSSILGSDGEVYGTSSIGYVVGSYSGGPFAWIAGSASVVTLTALPGTTYCNAKAVNDGGTIAGTCRAANGADHIVFWRFNGAGWGLPEDRGTSGSIMSVEDINNTEVVVGSMRTSSGPAVDRPFIYSPASGRGIQPLSGIGRETPMGTATAINDATPVQVAGTLIRKSNQVAIRWIVP